MLQTSQAQTTKPINMTINDFFSAYSVKRPSRSVQNHNPDFVAGQLRNLEHLLNLNLTDALRRELKLVQEDWLKIFKTFGPVFNLEMHLQANETTVPNSAMISDLNEAKTLAENMRKARASLPDNAPFWVRRKMDGWIREYGRIIRVYGFDTSRGTTASRPAKYLAKKAQHRAESQAIRQRMQTSKGKK